MVVNEMGMPDSGKASWNINSRYSQLIAQRLELSQRCFDANNFIKYFKTLQSIYELTTHNLNNNVIEKMDELRMKILRNQKYFIKCSEKNNEKVDMEITDKDKKGKWTYTEDIRIYNRNLLKILKASGFLTNVALRSHIKF